MLPDKSNVDLGAEGIFHTGIQRTVGGGKQVAFDSRFLCGNGKGAAEQNDKKWTYRVFMFYCILVWLDSKNIFRL